MKHYPWEFLIYVLSWLFHYARPFFGFFILAGDIPGIPRIPGTPRIASDGEPNAPADFFIAGIFIMFFGFLISFLS
jgi:hypothetical protein